MLPAVVLASWLAQAQPAPVAAPPLTTAPQPPPAPLDNRVGVVFSYARQLGEEATNLGPPNGFGMGVSYQRRVLPLPNDFDMSAGGDYFFEKFSSNTRGEVEHNEFAATAAAAWHRSRLRPYAEVGVGFTVAYAGDTTIQPLVRTTAGLDIAVTRDIAVAMRVAYAHVFTNQTGAYSLASNLLDAGAGVALGF